MVGGGPASTAWLTMLLAAPRSMVSSMPTDVFDRCGFTN